MAEARSLLEKYEALADKRAMQRGMVAAAYDAIGERDKAIEILRRAANDHDLWLAHHISAAPCDGLRKDPRLADVFATVSAL